MSLCLNEIFVNEDRFDRIPIALRKAKIVYNFGLSECSRVKRHSLKT